MYRKKTGLSDENWIYLENPVHQTKVASEVLNRMKLKATKQKRINLRFNDSYKTVISLSLRKFIELKKEYKDVKGIKIYYKKKFSL